MSNATIEKNTRGQSRHGLKRADVTSRLVVSEVTDVSRQKAEAIAKMFEAALGKNGIDAPGHEPYPDPSLFSADGVMETVASPYRRLFIAELDGIVCGGIIADSLHELACENNCMAVDKTYRGLGIGSLLVEGARRIVDDCFFISNVTELVTHNLASQTAHIKGGYDRFLGFGYSHYPHVFFPDRPESVLWAGQLHGRLAGLLKQHAHKQSKQNISQELPDESSNSERALAAELVQTRSIYVPRDYLELAREILAQYADQLTYEVFDGTGAKDVLSSAAYGPVRPAHFEVDFKPDYAHTYIDFGYGFDIDKNEQAVKKEIDKVKNSPGKRFIRATLKANHASCVPLAEFLRREGFVFHSILPLYQYEKAEGSGTDGADAKAKTTANRSDLEHRFFDLLGLQWIAPDVVAANPLPGETRSVIKIYGYPLNLPGKIIALIRKELCR